MSYNWVYENVVKGQKLEEFVIEEVLTAIDEVENKATGGCGSNYITDNASHDSAYNASLTNYSNSSKNSSVNPSNYGYGGYDCTSYYTGVQNTNQSAANSSHNNLKCVNSFSCNAHS